MVSTLFRTKLSSVPPLVLGLVLIPTLALPRPADGQAATGPAGSWPAPGVSPDTSSEFRVTEGATLAPAAPAEGGSNAFLVEAGGGALGSISGIGAGYWLSDLGDCAHTEDLECILQGLGTMFLGGTVGAAVGSYGLGRWADTGPSGWGASLGSVAGFGVGIGILTLLDEAYPDMDTVTVFVTYGTIQGVVTAVGSRLGAGSRGG